MDHRNPGLHLILRRVTGVMGGLALAALLAGCRCASPPDSPPPRARPAPHFDEWDGLVRATVRGDLLTAQVVARDLTAEQQEGEAAARVGGALGFLQLAESPEELVDGLVSAAEACGSCHAGVGRAAPALPSWTHQAAAHRVMDALVWSVPLAPPPPSDPVLTRIREAWPSEDDAAARAQAVLRICQGCHAEPSP